MFSLHSETARRFQYVGVALYAAIMRPQRQHALSQCVGDGLSGVTMAAPSLTMFHRLMCLEVRSLAAELGR